MLRNLKKLETRISFKIPKKGEVCTLSILVFSDAIIPNEYGQLEFVAGIFLRSLKNGSLFHPLSWASHKSRRPAKFIGTAEILAAGEAIDEGEMLLKAYSSIMNMKLDLIVALDSKDLFQTLTTGRNATDRSIRADVGVISYEFETRNISKMIWIPGRINLADAINKPNDPLCQPLQLLMFEGTNLSTTANHFPKYQINSQDDLI